MMPIAMTAANRWRLVTGLLPLATGGLAAAAQQPGMGYLAWVALIPFGCAMARGTSAASLICAYVGGLLYYLLALDWMRTSYGGVGFDGPRAGVWLLTAQFSAPTWVIAMALGRWLTHRTPCPLWLALGVCWPLGEGLRDVILSSIAGPTAPWLTLGITQADSRLIIQSADLFGLTGVSFLLATVNGLFAEALLAGWPRRLRLIGAAAVAVLLCCAYGALRTSQGTGFAGPVVALMSPYARDERDAIGRVPRPVDLLLWSEFSFGGALFTNASGALVDEGAFPAAIVGRQGLVSFHELTDLSRDAQISMIVGCRRFELNQGKLSSYNSAAFIDKDRGYRGYYDKVYLVPYTEGAPTITLPAVSATKDPYARGRVFPVFELRTKAGIFQVAATICYDTCFDAPYQTYMAQSAKPDFFVACSREAADVTGRLPQAILGFAKVRAIETRRSMVRNVESGYSGIIDSNGRLVARPPEWKFDEPVNLGRIPIDDRVSLYSIWGNWPVGIFLACFVGWAVIRHR